MKNINKRSDMTSRRALKKSVKASERQAGRKELIEAVNDDSALDPVFWGCGCSCGCNGWSDDLEYMPIAEQTIGGQFLKTLEKLELITSYKKDNDISELYYKLAKSPNGVIASFRLK